MSMWSVSFAERKGKKTGLNLNKQKIRWLISCDLYLSLQLLDAPRPPPLRPRHPANLCSAQRLSGRAAPVQNAWSPVPEAAPCPLLQTQDSASAFPTLNLRSHQPVLCHPSLPHTMWVTLQGFFFLLKPKYFFLFRNNKHMGIHSPANLKNRKTQESNYSMWPLTLFLCFSFL